MYVQWLLEFCLQSRLSTQPAAQSHVKESPHAEALIRAEPSSLALARIRCDSGLCTVICQHEKENVIR